MNSLTDLREVVDVVIGVDTHVHTHSAAVVDAERQAQVTWSGCCGPSRPPSAPWGPRCW